MRLNLNFIPPRGTKLYLAGLAGLGILGILILVTLAVSKKAAPVPEVPKLNRSADMQFQEIHYTSTNQDGVKEWELKAVSANYFQKKKLAELKKIHVAFYSKAGQIITLQGDSGQFNTDTKDIHLTGHIVGTSSDGYTFQTNALAYDAKTNQARAEGKVFFESPQFNLEGTGMIVDLEKQKVFLLNKVSAQGKK